MKIMGILNITPDSFSDGNLFRKNNLAIEHGKKMILDGANIIDIGGESTRPGSTRISPKEQIKRTNKIIKQLSLLNIKTSIDTTSSKVAYESILAGATIVNDVSGGSNDKNILNVVKDANVHYIIMHSRIVGGSMDNLDNYTSKNGGIAKIVADELKASVDNALKVGINENKLIIDPGLGFAKVGKSNWELLENIDELKKIGLPILIAGSRKRFLQDFSKTKTPKWFLKYYNTFTDLSKENEYLKQSSNIKENKEPINKKLKNNENNWLEIDKATAALSYFSKSKEFWGVRVHNISQTMLALR